MDPQANPLANFIFPAAIFAIFYFLIIRPQRQKDKEHKETLAKIAKNDEVITAGGIHATVVNVKEQTVIARIDENVKVELEKSSIVTVKSKKS